jgi:tRNA nucleotidyltransferase (CCA-adding enzyme)
MIRVLHNLSFVEDPTRIFRAIRFEQRLHFRLGESTHRLIKDAVAKDLFENIVGPRLFSELVLILKEKNPLPALSRMEELGVLGYIHPRIRITRKIFRLFRTLKRNLEVLGGEDGESWTYYLMALTDSLGSRQIQDLFERLAVPPRYRTRLMSLFRDGRSLEKKLEAAGDLLPGQVFDVLSPYPQEVVIFSWARTTRRPLAAAIGRYLKESRRVRIFLRGQDLKDLGHRPGPLYREIIAALLREKITGRIVTREDEILWVKSHYPVRRGSGGPGKRLSRD